MSIKKRKKSKSRAILLGFLLIILGIILPISKFLYKIYLSQLEKEKVENFFSPSSKKDFEDIKEEINEPNIVTEITEQNKQTEEYIAVLEIPSISLKKGLVSKDSKTNNINKNIQILKDSTMPDVTGGNFILASHSGTNYLSFFKNLRKVKINDIIYVYYNNIKYTYKVSNIYSEIKDGDIVIHRDISKTVITLTTCSQNDKDQLVVIGELINTQNY